MRTVTVLLLFYVIFGGLAYAFVPLSWVASVVLALLNKHNEGSSDAPIMESIVFISLQIVLGIAMCVVYYVLFFPMIFA